jgi:hypothetical protein
MIALTIPATIAIFAAEYSVYSQLLGIPSVILESAMACRVFRQLRIGLITEIDGTTKSLDHGPLVFNSPPQSFGSTFRCPHCLQHGGIMRTIEYREFRDPPDNASVTKLDGAVQSWKGNEISP